ncbi:MAG: hypothetical protein WD009_08500 [Phycisphaeraceae bacterium]
MSPGAQDIKALDDPNAVMPGFDVPRSGLALMTARTIDEVVDAWRLVYRTYLAAGRITPNNVELFTRPEAVGPESAVFMGRINGLTATTLTAIGDSERGLPLDCAFPTQLNAWRDEGRRLVAVDLFADRRQQSTRRSSALFELLRHAFFHCLASGATDMLCTVPVQWQDLYTTHFGFQPVPVAPPQGSGHDDCADEERAADSGAGGYGEGGEGGGGGGLQLMRAIVADALDVPSERSAFAPFLKHPLPDDALSQRFDFNSAAVATSAVGAFLQSSETGGR